MPSFEAFGDGHPAIPDSELSLKVAEPESLFDRFGWLYALLRESFFRDDTPGMEVALWPQGSPGEGHRLLEVGCGPGFYSRRFARRFPHLQVIGLDRSEVQLRHARRAAQGLANCTFLRGNLLSTQLDPVDGILAVRLFTVLQRRSDAMAAIFRLLKPGGRCVIAEPRAGARTQFPLQALWGLARLESLWRHQEAFCEPGHVKTFTPEGFTKLIGSQPWSSVSRWQDTHYQYAICEKGCPRAAAASSETDDYSI